MTWRLDSDYFNQTFCEATNYFLIEMSFYLLVQYSDLVSCFILLIAWKWTPRCAACKLLWYPKESKTDDWTTQQLLPHLTLSSVSPFSTPSELLTFGTLVTSVRSFYCNSLRSQETPWNETNFEMIGNWRSELDSGLFKIFIFSSFKCPQIWFQAKKFINSLRYFTHTIFYLKRLHVINHCCIHNRIDRIESKPWMTMTFKCAGKWPL